MTSSENDRYRASPLEEKVTPTPKPLYLEGGFPFPTNAQPDDDRRYYRK